MSLLAELQGIITQEPQEDSGDDLQSQTWGEFARNNTGVFDRVMEEIVENVDRAPEALVEAASNILESSSHISSLRNHKEDFERLLGDASGLVVVLWQSYNESKSKYHSLTWPPPKFRKAVDELVKTVERIHGLIKRKSKNFAKRILVGVLGIRDLGKLEKYQRRLDSVATSLESKPNTINIKEVLVEVVNSRPQPHDDAEPSEEPVEGDSPTPVKQGKKRGRHPANQQAESEDVEEDDQWESKSLGKKKAQSRSEDDSDYEQVEDQPAKYKPTKKEEDVVPPELKGSTGPKNVRRTKFDEEALRQESKDKGRRSRFKGSDEDVEEDTGRQGSRTKSKTKKKLSQAYDDEDDNVDSDVPIGDPVAAKGPSKKKRPATNPKRSQTMPVSPPPGSISGFSFNNNGPGTMTNKNVGNIYNSNISDVGNDNSVNHFHARKRTYA